MGNFYANITLVDADAEAVVNALASLKREAWVATERATVVVFDRACDEQDVEQLEQLTVALTKRLQCSALAACNHDDDTLLLVLATSGKMLDRYNSNPGYFDGREESPSGGNAERLSAVFHSPAAVVDVERALRADHAEYVLEVDRHRALQSALGMPETLSFLGYRYVSAGDLHGGPAAATLRHVGDDGDASLGAAIPNPVPMQVLHAEATAAFQAEPDTMWNTFALYLQEVDVPERAQVLFGVERGNGGQLLERLRHYIIAHDLIDLNLQIHADEPLVEFLGEREFGMFAVPGLLLAALKLEPMSAEQIADFKRGDPDLLGRLMRGLGE
jgi:hypothetical protein